MEEYGSSPSSSFSLHLLRGDPLLASHLSDEVFQESIPLIKIIDGFCHLCHVVDQSACLGLHLFYRGLCVVWCVCVCVCVCMCVCVCVCVADLEVRSMAVETFLQGYTYKHNHNSFHYQKW